MHYETPARISNMELTTAKEDDCNVSREDDRRDCEWLAVGRNVAGPVITSSFIDSRPTPDAKCDLGRRVQNCSVCSGALDHWPGRAIPHARVHEVLGSQDLPIVDGIQSATLSCAGKSNAAFEAVLRPAKGPATEDIPICRVVEPMSFSKRDLFVKVQFVHQEEFYG